MKYDLKDSGKRQKFSTGAQRDMRENKGRYDLLPGHSLYRLAVVFEKGAKKYTDDNWRKGIPLRRYADSAMRHMVKALQGHCDEDHWAQAMWNISCLIETKYMIDGGLLPKELDNLPNYACKNDPSIQEGKKK